MRNRFTEFERVVGMTRFELRVMVFGFYTLWFVLGMLVGGL